MREQLNILIMFNSDDHIKLILREIKKAGYDVYWKKVLSKELLNDLLVNETWHIIFSEHIIDNKFNVLNVLKIRNELAIKTPLILICQNIKNESLIEIMKNGCNNCIINNKFSQIGSILTQEIENYKLQLEEINEITQIKNHYNKLLFNVKRYDLAIEGSNDGIWDWDIPNDKGYISFKWKEMLNIENCEFKNFLNTWMDLIHPDDIEIVVETLEEYLYKKSPYFICKYRLKSKNSNYIWVLTRGKAIRNSDGIPIKMAGSHTNIDETKRAEEKINHLAYYDIVTGLANRTLFDEKLKKCITYSKKNKESFAIIYLDLDNFKTVNDTLGHAFGDLLLKDVATLLKKFIGKYDLAARLGGDEFVIIIPTFSSYEKLKTIADSIKNEFQKPFILSNNEIYITVSIGITIYPNDGEDEQTLLKNADTAMYCAKETGKNNYKFYIPEMNMKIMKKLKLQNDLRNALKNEEFVVYYQPQVNVETGDIIGFEALVRWIHPINGIVSPVKFIPEAEEMGIIIDIGEFVLRSVCKQNMIWQQKGYSPKYIAVNLSPRQFQQKNLLKTIENILNETGLDPQWLEIEITESISMADLDFTVNMLNKFNEIGLQVALDDFGTGYSSLNYLKKLPIQTLKIDKSFVDDITSNPKELAIAKTIATLAHTLNLSIVAEGVETEEQLLLLKQLKCDKAQGYLFSKPLPAEEIEKILYLNVP